MKTHIGFDKIGITVYVSNHVSSVCVRVCVRPAEQWRIMTWPSPMVDGWETTQHITLFHLWHMMVCREDGLMWFSKIQWIRTYLIVFANFVCPFVPHVPYRYRGQWKLLSWKVLFWEHVSVLDSTWMWIRPMSPNTVLHIIERNKYYVINCAMASWPARSQIYQVSCRSPGTYISIVHEKSWRIKNSSRYPKTRTNSSIWVGNDFGLPSRFAQQSKDGWFPDPPTGHTAPYAPCWELASRSHKFRGQ